MPSVELKVNEAQVAKEVYDIGKAILHKCLTCNRGEEKTPVSMSVQNAGVELTEKKSGKITCKSSLRLTCDKCHRLTCKYLGKDESLPAGHTLTILTILHGESPVLSEEPSPEFRERVEKKQKRKIHKDNVQGKEAKSRKKA